jgi:hypothetical protein
MSTAGRRDKKDRTGTRLESIRVASPFFARSLPSDVTPCVVGSLRIGVLPRIVYSNGSRVGEFAEMMA